MKGPRRAAAPLLLALAIAACREPPRATSTSSPPSPSPSPSMATAPPPVIVARTSSGTWGIAHVPSSIDHPRPPIVYMHGMWASPEDSCPYFEVAAATHGFLVCPRGNAPLGAGHQWSGDYAAIAPRLTAALDAADALAPGVLDRRTHAGTLIGFSSGAAFAVKVALGEEGRWSGLVLMSMSLKLDADRLKGAGIRRIVFGAGDLDGSRVSLERATRAMNAAGLESRYVSLGPVGHSFAKDMVEKMTDAIAWVRGAGDAE